MCCLYKLTIHLLPIYRDIQAENTAKKTKDITNQCESISIHVFKKKQT